MILLINDCNESLLNGKGDSMKMKGKRTMRKAHPPLKANTYEQIQQNLINID